MILLHTGSGFQWYRTYQRGYETSGSLLRFMLRRSSLVECVTRNVFTKRQFFFIHQYVQTCLSKVHILYHKELADARIILITEEGAMR